MRKITSLLILLTFGHDSIGQCQIRPRTLYYYNSGTYQEYKGGNHGPLYYKKDDHYHHYEQIVLVPKAIEVEVHRDHYYSINQAAYNDLLADAIVGRLIRLQGNSKPDATGTRPATNTPTISNGLGIENVEQAGPYQEAGLLKLVNEKCAKCHNQGSKNTTLVTKDGKLADISSGKAWECFGLVNTGEMPKGGRIEDEEVKLFYGWAKSARKK